MATTYKILGQAKPVATTDTTLYTVPTGSQATVNIFICNQATTEDIVRIALVPSGQTLGIAHYIFYDTTISANSSVQITGIALNSGDFIVVYSTNGTTSFTVTGIEKT